ncbi:hypothetical protein ACFV23_21395 [Streptomyces sp. NPDC059627]
MVLRNPRMRGIRSRKTHTLDPDTGTENERWEVVCGDDGEPVRGQWERIISVEQWEALLEVIGENMQPGNGHNSRKYLLTGTLRCDKDECGAAHRATKAPKSANKPAGFFYYMCPDKAVTELVIAKYEEEAAARQAEAAPREWDGEERLARVSEDIGRRNGG